jgi:hypothetical protein
VLRIAAPLSALFVASLLCTAAAADPIGPTGCTDGTCQGGIYTLEHGGAPIASDATTETFRITFTMNTAGLSIVNVAAVDTVAVKIAPSINSGSIFDAPASATWTGTATGLNANGCGNGGGGFYCAEVTGGTAPTTGGILKWIFDIVIQKNTLLDGTDEASVKARFVDANGDKVGDLLSEPITLQEFPPIPEPGSAMLLGSGLLGLAFAGSRRRARS